MATQSSREAALERRKALADGGKKAAGRYNNNPGRVRSASDARPTRTNTPVATAADVLEVAASAPAPRAARSLSAPSAAPRSGNVRRVSNPSRDLVLARRDALAKRGKSASTSAKSGTAAVVRQGNPDLSTRELAQKLRELKNKSGSAGVVRSGSGSGSQSASASGSSMPHTAYVTIRHHTSAYVSRRQHK